VTPGLSRPKPLAHIRVLDLSRLLPGAMATLHLANLGADVIAIRSLTPEEPSDQRKLLHLMLSRNKRGLGIDLAREEGRELFLQLARESDIVVEGFRPGVVDRLGIGYDTVQRVNPRVVYCSISGYGQDGPDRLRAGHDINYMAAAGVAEQIGVRGGAPAIPNLQIADLLGGSLTAVMGILAALVDAQSRGVGRYVDISMTDSLMAHSVLALSAMGFFGQTAPRGRDLLSGGMPCYGYYQTSDGRYLAVGALERKFWERLCDALGRPDLKSRHLVNGAEAARIRGELEAIFGAQTADHWTRVFQDLDCCVNLVLTLEEAIAREQAVARRMVVQSQSDEIGSFLEFAPPLTMSDFQCNPDSPRSCGESHAVEILGAAGFSAAQIEAFRAARIVS